MNEEAEQEQREWEAEVAENLQQLYEQSDCGCDGVKILTIDGTAVSQKRGKVLLSGYDYTRHQTTLYDFESGNIQMGPLTRVKRNRNAAVTLRNGNVMVFGGHNEDGFLTSCELLDVKKMTFSEVGHMLKARHFLSAVLLKSGLVFIVGGYDMSCELYDPADNSFRASKAKTSTDRFGHSASLLPNGKVLVCGGDGNFYEMQTTEIYDPETDSFSDGPMMNVKRCYHTATTLADGRVLVCAGDVNEDDDMRLSTEIYDPESNSFSLGPELNIGRHHHFASLLPDGRVWVGGGDTTDSRITTEFFNPDTNSFTPAIYMWDGYQEAIASPY
jgi:hypothetical protein